MTIRWKLKSKIVVLFDRLNSKKIFISLADLFLVHSNISVNQLIVATRFLDFKNYLYSINNKVENLEGVFYWQDRISMELYNGDYDVKEATNKFVSLINSYDKNGYDSNSYFKVDNNFCVMDGTHRLALNCFYSPEKLISVRVIKRKLNFDTAENYFKKLSFTDVEISNLKQQYYELFNSLPLHSFLCVIKDFNDSERIKNILKNIKFCSIDYIQQNGDDILLYVSFDDPRFILNKKYMPISQNAVFLENELKKELQTEKVYVYKNITESLKWLKDNNIKIYGKD